MKTADLKTKETSELEGMIKESLVKLGKLNFERQSKTLKKSHDIGILRRDIARMKTLMRERVLAASN